MIYFASDIHLGSGNAAEAKRSEQAFCRWLDHVASDAKAIYLLGDIFDFWFEYQRVVPQGFVRVLGRLAELHDRGVEIVFYTGNHDMWCYNYLTRECGIRIEHRPAIESLYGKRIHLAHGDNLNIKGQPMLRLMNALFHSRLARKLFSWLIHPDLALRFGAWWSGKSRKSHRSEWITPKHLDYLIEYAQKCHSEHGDTDAYIFGHMHLAHQHEDENFRVLFLSDWSGKRATYASMDPSANLELKTFAIDETIS